MGTKIILGGSIPSKKNNKKIVTNRRTGRPLIISSDRYQQWHTSAMWQLKKYKPVDDYPIRMSIVFFFPDNRRRDLDNGGASVVDVLTDAGVLEDDDWKHIQELHLLFGGISKLDSRCEINIEPCN
jgi:Holliday junction resolvase RusA-like endonuclease